MLTFSFLGLAGMVLTVAVVSAVGLLTFESALVLTFLLGLFDGLFGVPAVLLLAQVVEPRYLGSAIGLGYLTSGIGRLVGGPVGGTTLQVAGPVAAFVPAALGLLLAGIVIATTPVLRGGERRGRSGGAGGLRPALRYLRREPVVLGVTLLGTLSGASIFAYTALLPAFTRDSLGGGSATLGLLSGISGIGSIGAALAMETLGKRFGRGRVVVGMFVLSGVAVGALGLTQILPVALVLVTTITFLSVVFGGTAQLLVQTVPPPNLRASVVAIYTFSFYCVLPIGTAVVGRLADAVGVTAVLLGMTALTVIGGGAILLFDPRLVAATTDDPSTPPKSETAGADAATAVTTSGRD